MTDQVMEDKLAATLAKTWDLVRAIEPAHGQVPAQQVLEVRTALDAMAAERARARQSAALEGDAATQADGSMATIYARAAAVAIAAGDESNAGRWLIEAERLSRDDDQRAEIAAARGSYERYRALVHGRNLIASDRESAARKVWKQLSRPGRPSQGAPDAIARAAAHELEAPRPLRPQDQLPTLSRYNGIGAGFYGRRDTWSDGSYATTHCISILWIPVLPLSAWRVRDADDGYQIFAREQLSSFARFMRWALPTAAVLAIAVYAITSYLRDPARLAKQRWDEALEIASTSSAGDPEAGLRALDGELQRDLSLVDTERAERAGAGIVRLTSGYVATPFTADKLDQVLRVVHRYQALPPRAQSGAARSALLDRLDGWAHQLGAEIDNAEQRLTLLRAAAGIASADRRAQYDAQITVTRLELADAKQADWPLDALAILVDTGERGAARPALERADEIVARLCESPSLLVDAGADLDAWASVTHSIDLRHKASSLRDDAASNRAAAEAEGVTPKQLAGMQAKRPLDQFVALQIARNEASAGDVERAAARLARLGPPGVTIRSARLMLAQLAAGQGKLDVADAQLAALLGARLQRFTAASAALRDAVKLAQERIKNALDTGNVPPQLRVKYQAASESERSGVIDNWVDEQMKNDTAIQNARAKYLALADVVPVALTAGTVKLRRAQAMSGGARNAMLEEAERTFLAIRTEAEGQPSFRISLGEIYARLGKTKESDAEFAQVLANHDPELTMQVASVYRAIGSVSRAKQIANEVYSTASSPHKEGAAVLLGLMTQDEEAEGWFRKADQKSPFVKASLLELEARRLRREGKAAECAAKYAQAARMQLALASASDVSGYNNAALAYERSFDCSGDPHALRDADAALETAYRRAPEDPIVVSNLTYVLRSNGRVRVLARHIDVRTLRLRVSEIDELLDELLDGPERAALLAELAADPNLRRSHELLAQAEILMPNQPGSYAMRFAEAQQRRDLAEAAAVVDRARHATGLDVTSANAARERWRSGTDDAKELADTESARARLEPLLTRAAAARLDPKTRAAGWYVLARALSVLGVYKADKAALAAARDAAATAMKLWPVLDGDTLIVTALIDEAALDGDAKTWIAARRIHTALAALDQLVADRSPLADKIRATKQWAEVAAHAKLVGTPSLGDVRLARLLGDTALEARAKAVFDDKLVRLANELALLVEPDDPAAKQDRAFLDRR